MSDNLPDDWSPADNPYAIAVSEANWLRATVALAVQRMHGDDSQVGWFSSRQIDARTLVVALRQLLAAVKLEQIALADLSMDPAVGEALAQAQQRFEAALPDIKHVRDGLTHFEDWARGEGKFGPQAAARKAGNAPRDVARDFWSFGYDPAADAVTMGPFTIPVSAALPAASELCAAIYSAARAVDQRSTAEIRSWTVQALTSAAIPCDPPQGPVLVSPGNDTRIWVSFNLSTVPESGRTELAAKVVAAVAGAGLRLTSQSFPQAEDMAERLVVGEALRVERI
ncbi:hypothetical protein P3T36_003316 [Kitasatospora sp. MAP12-15]|uniref:hypothetical protein n=1 Tax=unclassified Kitasatospora TaxID=2633591 RepID=UPI002475E10F|nr:hypothetical protein [Kitasatospora sp. MAP12-44]MDH6111292.1 hypothetical protein [Kitasatospora sp. MAP12-44]